MKCPKCGYENSDDVLYCNLCHEVFRKASDYKEPSVFYEPYKPEEKRWKKWIGIDVLITIVIIIGLCFWGYKFFIGKKNAQPSHRDISNIEAMDIGFGEILSDLKRIGRPKITYPFYETEHFIIYGEKEEKIKAIGEQIEEYAIMPIKIGIGDFGFWQGGKIKIYIHNTFKDYQRITGRGKNTSGYTFLRLRAIHSYWDVEHLYEAVIPHELSHIILYEFMKRKKIPKWINEGFATYVELKYCPVYAAEYKRLMDELKNKYIKIERLDKVNKKESSLKDIQLWYVQCWSIVSYLIDKYGSDRFFHNFLINIREGKDLDYALSAAYSPDITCVEELENKWIKYISLKFKTLR